MQANKMSINSIYDTVAYQVIAKFKAYTKFSYELTETDLHELRMLSGKCLDELKEVNESICVTDSLLTKIIVAVHNYFNVPGLVEHIKFRNVNVITFIKYTQISALLEVYKQTSCFSPFEIDYLKRLVIDLVQLTLHSDNTADNMIFDEINEIIQNFDSYQVIDRLDEYALKFVDTEEQKRMILSIECSLTVAEERGKILRNSGQQIFDSINVLNMVSDGKEIHKYCEYAMIRLNKIPVIETRAN